MINIKDKSKCSGCSACANVCPLKCITMQHDEEGFLYPHIYTEKCIDCNKCEMVCPILSENTSSKKEVSYVYAAYNKDQKIRLESSSGGLFSLLASEILKMGGVVFGAAFNKDMEVSHIHITKQEDLWKLRGSKYVQSKIGAAYLEAKKFLDNGIKVLFTGTPCQIGGLLAYLGRDYENLYTQDIICHGVPSPLVWNRYLKYQEKRTKSKIRKIFFRHKKYGWKMYAVLLQFSNNKEYNQIHNTDLFMRAFLKNLSLRPSCYDCSYKTIYRQADITLADFWGVNKILPEMDDDKGTSVLFVNSDKGNKLFAMLRENIVYQQTNIETVLPYNKAMTISENVPENRNDFMKEIVIDDFDKVVDKYLPISKTKNYKQRIKLELKRFLRFKNRRLVY